MILKDTSLRTAGIWFAVLLFLLLFAAGASKPLHLDNMDFPAVAEATAQKGVPVYYRGEQNPNHLGLYHPPLYIYLLALWFKVFGSGPAQARLFGASCTLLHGMCILLLVSELFGRDYAHRAAPWFWAVFLLNAYTIQTAAITDIDSTIYGPLILGFLWAILRLSWCKGVWRKDQVSPLELLLAVLILSLCLWAKLTTVWLVLPFVFLLLVSRFGWLRAASLSTVIALAGVLGFLVTYWAYGKLLSLPVDYTFTFTLASFHTRGSSGGSGLGAWLNDRWNNLRVMLPFMAGWTGLTPWAGLAAGSTYAIWRWLRKKERQSLHAALLLLLAGLSTLYYCAKVITFGAAPFKYTYVYWGVAIAAAVITVLPPEERRRPVSIWGTVSCAGLWIAAAIVGVGVVRDKALLVPSERAALNWVLLVPMTIFVSGLIAGARGRAFAGRALGVSGVILYGGLQAGTAIYQSSQDYATSYDYGQRGFVDTVSYVRTHTDPNDVIVSMKDIGYAAHRRYFENYAAVYGDSQQSRALMDLTASGVAKLAIFTEGRGQDQLVVNPPLRDWITGNCRLLASFGDYRLYGECSKQPRKLQ